MTSANIPMLFGLDLQHTIPNECPPFQANILRSDHQLKRTATAAQASICVVTANKSSSGHVTQFRGYGIGFYVRTVYSPQTGRLDFECASRRCSHTHTDTNTHQLSCMPLHETSRSAHSGPTEKDSPVARVTPPPDRQCPWLGAN